MAYEFPDLSHAPKGQNGDDITGSSIGTNKILLTFKEMAAQRGHKVWDLYLFNVYTLARNVFDQATSANHMAQLIDTDVEFLMSYIEAYHAQSPRIDGKINYPKLVFYLPIYDRIPKYMLREHTGKTAQMDDWYLKYISRFPRGPTDITQSPLSQCFTTVVGQQFLPFREIDQEIKDRAYNLTGYGYPQILMMTHCLLDYYLSLRYPVQIIESYTGQIKDPKTFGLRLDKEGRLPFNRITHRIFGDSIWISPLATGKLKTQMLKMAEERKWIQKTEYEIIRDLVVNFNVEEKAVTDLRI